MGWYRATWARIDLGALEGAQGGWNKADCTQIEPGTLVGAPRVGRKVIDPGTLEGAQGPSRGPIGVE